MQLTGRYSFAIAVRRILTLIDKYQPHIIHSSLFRSNIVSRFAGLLSGRTIVNSWVNDSYADIRYLRLGTAGARKLRMIQALDWATSSLVTLFLANSRAVRDANCRKLRIPYSSTAIIYRGRSIEDYRPVCGREVMVLRDELHLPMDTKVILNVGRLTSAKNQIDLLRAMPMVVQETPTCRLIIAGGGDQYQLLARAIDQLGLTEHVSLLGNRDDIARLYRVADLFVLPSLYEGHPGAMVEAMIAGLPIVASDIPVHREVLMNGALGELASLDDIASLAQKIIILLNQKEHAKNLAACARASALQRFDINKIAVLHDELYASLAARQG